MSYFYVNVMYSKLKRQQFFQIVFAFISQYCHLIDFINYDFLSIIFECQFVDLPALFYIHTGIYTMMRKGLGLCDVLFAIKRFVRKQKVLFCVVKRMKKLKKLSIQALIMGVANFDSANFLNSILPICVCMNFLFSLNYLINISSFSMFKLFLHNTCKSSLHLKQVIKIYLFHLEEEVKTHYLYTIIILIT